MPPLRSIALGALSFLLLTGPALGQCALLGSPGFTGCSPGGGIAPTLTCFGAPTLGSVVCSTTNPGACGRGFTLAATGLAPPSFLVLGACSNPPFYLALTAPVCPPSILGGCFAFVDMSGYLIVTDLENCVGCGAGTGLPIPANPALVGVQVCAQAFGCTSLAGPCACIAISNGLSITIQP